MTRDRALALSGAWITAVVGAVTFCLAYDDGGYSLASRSTGAIAVWWTILVAVVLGVWPRERIARRALLPGVLLALFAGWELASTAWSASPEDAFQEFDRTALYLGIYVLVVIASGRGRLARWIDGLTIGIAAIGVVALISRFFPGSFPGRGLPTLLPEASTRLSFPLGYWNGLGILVGIAFPLLLHAGLTGSRARRLAALGILPALGTVVYLTSSRGAVAALAGGTLVFVLGQPRRWTALAATLTAASGIAAAIAVVAPRHALVDGPLASAAARSEGRQAAALILLICVATAAVAEAGVAVAPRVPIPARSIRRLSAAGIIVLVFAGLAYKARASFEDFTRLPAVSSGGSVGEHLLSSSGSGRWQFWQAALAEFRSAPLLGRGAGSFEDWWAQHGSFRYFIKDAHSLFLQTLGELGAIGFVLLIGMLATGLTVAARRLGRAQGSQQSAIAGLLGSFVVYLIGAGIDWMWELTAVTAIGICVLGLLTGPVTAAAARPAEPGRRHERSWILVAAAGVLACGIIVTEAITLLAGIELSRSQAEARAGHTALARSHAIAATKIEPWAATPYLQLALVDQSAGDLPAAHIAIGRSIRADHDDWRPWLVAARIENRLGEIAAASHSLARAKSLNPRSPLVSLEG